jgi:hypothetical protein
MRLHPKWITFIKKFLRHGLNKFTPRASFATCEFFVSPGSDPKAGLLAATESRSFSRSFSDLKPFLFAIPSRRRIFARRGVGTFFLKDLQGHRGANGWAVLARACACVRVFCARVEMRAVSSLCCVAKAGTTSVGLVNILPVKRRRGNEGTAPIASVAKGSSKGSSSEKAGSSKGPPSAKRSSAKQSNLPKVKKASSSGRKAAGSRTTPQLPPARVQAPAHTGLSGVV